MKLPLHTILLPPRHNSLWVMLSMLFSFSIASSTNYYVSAIGNDANNGTSPTTAWRTHSAVQLHRYNPGDSVLYRRGDRFTGRLVIATGIGNGDSQRFITIGAFGIGLNPVFDGGRASGIWEVLRVCGVSYWTFRDLQIAGGLSREIRVTNDCGSHGFGYLKFLYLDLVGSTGQSGHCFQLFIEPPYSDSIYNVEVGHCTVTGGGEDGMNFFTVKHDLWVHDNYIRNSHEEGIDVAGGSRHIIERNFVKNAGAGGIKIHQDGDLSAVFNPLKNASVQLNVVDSCARIGGVGSGFGIFFSDMQGSRAYNNAVRMRGGMGAYAAFAVSEDNWGHTFRNNIFRNNLGIGNPIYQGTFRVMGNVPGDGRGSSLPDSFEIANVVDHNTWYNGSAANVYIEAGPGGVPSARSYGNSNWNTWTTRHGGEIRTNPQITDGLYLSSNSPCVDAGIDVGLTEDFDGVAIPIGAAPDIGAFEWSPIQAPHGSLIVSPQSLPSGGGSVTLTWTSTDATFASIDQGIGSVVLSGSVSVTVTNSTTFTLTLGNQSASRRYFGSVFVQGQQSILSSVTSGWNMTGVPVVPVNPAKASVYPTALSAAYRYENHQYVATDPLTNNRGWWIKFGADQQIIYTGAGIDSMVMDVRAGWNIVGSISTSVPVASVRTIPPGIINSPFFKFHDGFVVVDVLTPGGGYWVSVNQDGQLILK